MTRCAAAGLCQIIVACCVAASGIGVWWSWVTVLPIAYAASRIGRK